MRRRRSVGTGGAAALRFRFPASESSPSTIERANRPPYYGAGRRVSVAGRNDDSGRSPFSLRGETASFCFGARRRCRCGAVCRYRFGARRFFVGGVLPGGAGASEARSGRQRGLLPATAVKCSGAHSIRLSRMGIRLRPSSVSEYSTLGGTSACSCRQGPRDRTGKPLVTPCGPRGFAWAGGGSGDRTAGRRTMRRIPMPRSEVIRSIGTYDLLQPAFDAFPLVAVFCR